ncbi:MAG: dihydroorotate dehydrogenase electron transfer subunit [Clostridiales bacterium]|uniref:dihydroorotate dehydrogenase electron transfer subunit n=1 Tax=Clostridium sp. N3C TaxID=1776758 RepID=UPI00092E1700|nr:dihydroorotate dehydrogenase electron transfer subunit [Clostridium sp. N3C]NLZ49219.1 dihydroorotate dehydrogenase electron transfer subunit [Clostridiales bacterium]SCN22403.1 Dihydroorotate oxidase B, electron transfer subunit [Clostridium sp. N3C]
MPQYKKAKIISNEKIVNGIYKMAVEAEIKEDIKPGQFFMLRSWQDEPVLWRPISICEVKEGALVFLYAAVGRGTERLTELKKDEELQVMGPLGNGFDLRNIQGKVALIAGGIGIAPMVELSKRIKNAELDLYAGFRKDIYAVEDIKPYVNKVYISTEDGSVGHKGYVTEIFDASAYDLVLCCGPEVMMEKVVKECLEKDIKIYVSMEKHMACGIGACLVCTCKTKEGNKRTCKEGPVFDGESLVI